MRGKKKIKRLLLVWAVSVCLTGCGSRAEEAIQEKTQVSLWYYWGTSDIQRNLKRMVEQYNNSQEQTEVVLKYVPNQDFKKRLALSFADETAPDIALVDTSDFQYFQDMRSFVELTDQLPQLREYTERTLEPCKVGEKVYGVPFGINCTALFYNERMLEKQNLPVPQNWEEFQTAAKLLTDSAKDTYGFALPAAQGEGSVYAFLPILWSMGGDVDHLTSENGTAAFTLLAEMIGEGSISKSGISYTMDDLIVQFADGKLGMMFQASSAVEEIRERNPYLKFNVAQIPSDTSPVSVIGGEIFGVTPGEHEEAAIDFLDFMMQPERMAQYLEDCGMLAPREDIRKEQFLGDEVTHKFVELFEEARSRESTAQWPRVSQCISDAVSETLAGEKQTGTIAQEAEAEIKEIRKDAS